MSNMIQKVRAIERLNRSTNERYNRRLDAAGPGAFALGWGRSRYQLKRFGDLVHALDSRDIAGRSVLDIGCGLGDLYSYLQQRRMAPSAYRGIDINERFVEIASRRYPQAAFEHRDLLLRPYVRPVADTGVMLGIMNFKIAHQMSYARALITRAFGGIRSVLVVNAISDVHNEDYPREPFIHYYKPHDLFRFAQTLTPFCSLVHDYRGEPQNEFMLVLRKRPWREGVRS